MGQWLIVITLALLSIGQVEVVKGFQKFRTASNLIEE